MSPYYKVQMGTNVEFDFVVSVDSRQRLTDTSKSNFTLGTFSDICL